MTRALLLFFIFCISFKATAQTTYSVKGTFKGNFEGKVYLAHGDEKDSTFVKNGLFSFKGKIALPTLSYVFIKSSKTVTLDPFYLGDGEIVIEVDTVTKSGTRRSGRFEFISMQTRFLKKGHTDKIVDSVSNAISKITAEITDKESKADLTRENVMAFLVSNPNTTAAVAILKKYSGSFSKVQLKEVYQTLSPKIKNTNEGREILGATIHVVPVVIGEKIADFSQNDIKGKSLSIGSLRGKYVLIDFWASWCVPCRKENPAVVMAYNKFKNNGLEVLGVSLDSKKVDWIKAIKMDKLPWLHVSDLNGWNNEVSTMFGIRSIPDNMLIDRDGKVLARGLRGENLEKKLAEIFSGDKTN